MRPTLISLAESTVVAGLNKESKNFNRVTTRFYQEAIGQEGNALNAYYTALKEMGDAHAMDIYCKRVELESINDADFKAAAEKFRSSVEEKYSDSLLKRQALLTSGRVRSYEHKATKWEKTKAIILLKVNSLKNDIIEVINIIRK